MCVLYCTSGQKSAIIDLLLLSSPWRGDGNHVVAPATSVYAHLLPCCCYGSAIGGASAYGKKPSKNRRKMCIIPESRYTYSALTGSVVLSEAVQTISIVGADPRKMKRVEDTIRVRILSPRPWGRKEREIEGGSRALSFFSRLRDCLSLFLDRAHVCVSDIADPSP